MRLVSGARRECVHSGVVMRGEAAVAVVGVLREYIELGYVCDLQQCGTGREHHSEGSGSVRDDPVITGGLEISDAVGPGLEQRIWVYPIVAVRADFTPESVLGRERHDGQHPNEPGIAVVTA